MEGRADQGAPIIVRSYDLCAALYEQVNAEDQVGLGRHDSLALRAQPRVHPLTWGRRGVWHPAG